MLLLLLLHGQSLISGLWRVSLGVLCYSYSALLDAKDSFEEMAWWFVLEIQPCDRQESYYQSWTLDVYPGDTLAPALQNSEEQLSTPPAYRRVK